jgi:pimeloyl-ACP methyl ester carboxylesterase
VPTVSHDGVALAYEDRGEGSPAFVFVHGWMGNRTLFAPQAEYFAPRHRVISIDLRGHGDSDKPRGDYRIALLADDVAAVIASLSLGGVVAVGHSMGGFVVLQLAATHAQVVEAIVMVDPAPFVLTAQVRAGLEGLVAAIEAGDRDARRHFVANHMFLPASDAGLIDDVLRVVMSGPDHVAISAMRGILDFDALAPAAQCKAPALHLASARPLNPPHLMSQWLPTCVNGWTVGGGHFSQLEVPVQVNSMIDGFFRHHVASPSGARSQPR